VRTRSPLPQHPDEHRTGRPVLLAVDRELGEGPRLGVPPVGADCIGPVEVGEHEDMEQFGAGSRPTEGVELSLQLSLEFIRTPG
jgi:hypothetical protein